MRIGHGYDVHRLVSGRALILGGVTIPYEKGLDGHSDADVLVHAVMDALLGAAAMGDIGKLFPDNDDRYLGADSMELLREVSRRLEGAGYRLGNLDATIIAQRPKLGLQRVSFRCSPVFLAVRMLTAAAGSRAAPAAANNLTVFSMLLDSFCAITKTQSEPAFHRASLCVFASGISILNMYFRLYQ